MIEAFLQDTLQQVHLHWLRLFVEDAAWDDEKVQCSIEALEDVGVQMARRRQGPTVTPDSY